MFFVYLLLTIFLLGILIFVHEGGHFIVARLNGITVNEFAIGMGPKIFSRVSEKSNIRYSLRLFPIGGFVSMAGEDEESEDENAFYKKSVWRRILTVIAGPLTNIIIGFIGMFVLVSLSVQASNIVGAFNEGATSPDYGLMLGDEIVSVNDTATHTGDEVAYEITNQGYEPLDITVIRDGETIILKGVVFPQAEDSGVKFGELDLKFLQQKKTFLSIIEHSFWRSISTVKMIWDSIGDLVTGRYGLESMSGPVGMTQLVGTAVQASAQSLLYLMVIISVNLGVMNLLPLPALDGGRLIFLLYEAVTRRPVNKQVEGYINFVGIVLLLLLMVLITFKDIITLF